MPHKRWLVPLDDGNTHSIEDRYPAFECGGGGEVLLDGAPVDSYPPAAATDDPLSGHFFSVAGHHCEVARISVPTRRAWLFVDGRCVESGAGRGSALRRGVLAFVLLGVLFTALAVVLTAVMLAAMGPIIIVFVGLFTTGVYYVIGGGVQWARFAGLPDVPEWIDATELGMVAGAGRDLEMEMVEDEMMQHDVGSVVAPAAHDPTKMTPYPPTGAGEDWAHSPPQWSGEAPSDAAVGGPQSATSPPPEIQYDATYGAQLANQGPEAFQ